MLRVSAARRLLPLIAGLAVLVALVVGLFLGRGMASGAERVDDPVSIGFAARLHDRMPMVVPRHNWDAWLDPDLSNAQEALSLPVGARPVAGRPPGPLPGARRDLVAAGVPNPDAWYRLKPRCALSQHAHGARGRWVRAAPRGVRRL